MDKHDVGIATARGVERLSGPERDDLHVDACFGFEDRQDMAKQSGVLRRCGRGNDNGLVLRKRRNTNRGRDCERNHEATR